MFGRISSSYDFFNRLFSGGLDVHWRDSFYYTCVREWRAFHLHAHTRQDSLKWDVLDLATGSGDVGIMFQSRGHRVTGADFCFPLLEIARQKKLKALVQADALRLPFEAGSFDLVTIAFGYRNFTNRPKSLESIRETLKPGGMLGILEFTQPYAWVAPFYFFYLSRVMPLFVRLAGGQSGAYDYLARTVKDFPDAGQIASELASAGYSGIRHRRLTFGTVAIHTGFKSG